MCLPHALATPGRLPALASIAQCYWRCWSLGLVGTVQEIWLAKGKRIGSLLIYMTMGWLAVIVAGPFVQALTWPGFLWLAAGGLFYTVGIIFYAVDEKLR